MPTANVPSGTAFLATSSDRCARCAITFPSRVQIDPPGPPDPGSKARQRIPVLGVGGFGAHDPTARGSHGQDDPRMSTRTLILLAAITGLAILAASAIQILLAR